MKKNIFRRLILFFVILLCSSFFSCAKKKVQASSFLYYKSALNGSWYEDTLHEKSRFRDYFYRINDEQLSVIDKRNNRKETFFNYQISNGFITIESTGEMSKKIPCGTFPISIIDENQFTIEFNKPMAFIRNTYAEGKAIEARDKATNIALNSITVSAGAGVITTGIGTAGGILEAQAAAQAAAEMEAIKALPMAPIPHLINQGMAGQTNDVGVHYDWKRITYEGKQYKAVFPEFDSAYTAKLPNDLLKASDAKQFAESSKQLYAAIQSDRKLAARFTKDQIEQASYGWTPDGYTWHHNEQTGIIQLVDSFKHEQSRHTGGKAIWGGGKEYR